MNSVSFFLQIYQILSLPRQRPLRTLPGAIAPQIGWAGGVTTRGFGNQLQHTSNVDHFIFNALLVALVAVACGHEHAGAKFSHNTITLPATPRVPGPVPSGVCPRSARSAAASSTAHTRFLQVTLIIDLTTYNRNKISTHTGLNRSGFGRGR